MKRLRTWLAVICLCAAPVVAASAATGGPELRSDDELRINVTPEMRRHSRINHTLFFVENAFNVVVLLTLLATGASRWLRDAAFRITSREWLATLIFFFFFSVAVYLIGFALSWYSGYVVPHQFNLSNQSLGAWFVESLKASAIGFAIAAPLVLAALWGIAKFPNRWWLVLWAGSIPISIFLVVVTPIVIEPLFNDFKALSDTTLEKAIRDESTLAGIGDADIFEVNKSKQTKTMNAYVTGLGPTKRIVIWDTLLAKMDHDEVLFVVGHEIGHYVMNHLWKGLGFGYGVMFFVLIALQRLVEWGTSRFGPRWGFSRASEAGAIPWLLLVLAIAFFVLTPLFNWFSRRLEHQADVYGLNLTHLNRPAAVSFVKFAEDSKVDPYPSKFIELWMYTHPPLGNRVKFALEYRPREK